MPNPTKTGKNPDDLVIVPGGNRVNDRTSLREFNPNLVAMITIVNHWLQDEDCSGFVDIRKTHVL